jgi:hypothetical protein
MENDDEVIFSSFRQARVRRLVLKRNSLYVLFLTFIFNVFSKKMIVKMGASPALMYNFLLSWISIHLSNVLSQISFWETRRGAGLACFETVVWVPYRVPYLSTLWFTFLTNTPFSPSFPDMMNRILSHQTKLKSAPSIIFSFLTHSSYQLFSHCKSNFVWFPFLT